MAAAAPATGGFSYAQAARGKQTTASPAEDVSDSIPVKDWAEDAEDIARTKTQDASPQEETAPVERPAVPVKASYSGISSPDVASATSHDDNSTITQNASSASSWEAKSQGSDTIVGSEPAWIAERKERQSTQKVESKSGSNTTIMPEQKPVVLHDAAPPTVNPWAKRAEEAKAKQVTIPVSKATPAPAARPAQNKENQKPKSDWQHKSTPSIQSVKADTTAKTARNSKAAAPPSVQDQTSWPTPEVTVEERKPVTNHQPTEIDEDATAGKPRKKQEWKPVPVVPNIIWETPGVQSRVQRSSPNGERAPRGGASTRGRGGARGASNAQDRAQTSEGSPVESTLETESESRPSKTQRKAPKEADEVNVESNDAVKSVDTPLTNGDATTLIEATAEGRKDVRNGENKEWSGTRGAARRGGRGRGGRGDLANGHAHFANGHGSDYGSSYAGSPTHARGGFQFGSGRAGRANNNRAQSLPFGVPDMRYGFYGQPFMYPMDPYAMGVPQSPFPDFSPHIAVVTQQLDYYFSIENLIKDTFLRRNMDSQGFVLLEVIAGFNRMKQLTSDSNIIKMASYQSAIIEVVIGDDGKERLRKANEWQKWVMPVEERTESARNEGPQQYENLHKQFGQAPPRPHMSLPFIHNARPGDRRSYDFSYGMGSQMSPQAMFSPEYGHFSNGFDDSRGRHAKAAPYENGVAPDAASQKPHDDADVFPDDKVDQLTVCVKADNDKAPQYNAASRTFSNGSIDAKAVEQDLAKPEVNGKTQAAAVKQDLAVFWIKDEEQPVSNLPSNLTPEPYRVLRAKALNQRESASTGDCPYDLEVLYQFWSHFLIRNFNNSMYSEFAHLAEEDLKTRYSNVGHRNLTKYYDQAMHSSNVIPLRVAKDYITLAKAEKDGEAFKNLLKAWRNGALNLRNRKRVVDILDDDMRRLLES